MKRLYIDVTSDIRKQLLEETGLSEAFVSQSLNFKRDGEGVGIRALALKLGGVLRNDLPEEETIQDSDNTLSQTLANGITIKTYKATGLTELCRGEKTIGYFLNPPFSVWSKIQEFALGL